MSDKPAQDHGFMDPVKNPSPFGVGNKIERAAWGLVWLLLARWTPPPLHGWRAMLVRLFGGSVGSGSRIYGSARIWLPRNLAIGERSIVGPGVNLYNQGRITIGDGCVVSQGTHLCASTHRLSDPGFTLETRPITMEDGCWAASEAFVGPGVTMQASSVVGARGALFEDTEPSGIYLGNPAKRVGTRRLSQG